MSKMKRRFLRNKRRAERKAHIASAMDTHHLCFQRRYWKGSSVSEFRSYWYCKIDIPKDTLHRAIHEGMNHVPVPKPVNARGALWQLKKLHEYNAIHDSDSIEKRLEILIALFDCAEQPTADAFRKQLEIVHKFNKKSPR